MPGVCTKSVGNILLAVTSWNWYHYCAMWAMYVQRGNRSLGSNALLYSLRLLLQQNHLHLVTLRSKNWWSGIRMNVLVVNSVSQPHPPIDGVTLCLTKLWLQSFTWEAPMSWMNHIIRGKGDEILWEVLIREEWALYNQISIRSL